MLVVTKDYVDEVFLVLPDFAKLVVYLFWGEVFLASTTRLFLMLGRMGS